MCARVAAERSSHLIVGAGTNSTRATVEALAPLADVNGATAALCVVPYYVRPSQAGIVAHMKAVAGASGLKHLMGPHLTGRAACDRGERSGCGASR